jgi:hypothetical protein
MQMDDTEKEDKKERKRMMTKEAEEILKAMDIYIAIYIYRYTHTHIYIHIHTYLL